LSRILDVAPSFQERPQPRRWPGCLPWIYRGHPSTSTHVHPRHSPYAHSEVTIVKQHGMFPHAEGRRNFWFNASASGPTQIPPPDWENNLSGRQSGSSARSPTRLHHHLVRGSSTMRLRARWMDDSRLTGDRVGLLASIVASCDTFPLLCEGNNIHGYLARRGLATNTKFSFVLCSSDSLLLITNILFCL
jgi:hypothetical protein